MLHLFLIATLLVAIATAGLAVGVIVRGKFPNRHIGHNPELKKRGITCAKNDSAYCQGRPELDACKGCGG